ncbi:MAG: carbohydrate-binding domain-containing protein [Ruminococcus sp.]|nr:carbohydrate-binding domain-containing protein [Ruminococcus sp.]
MTTRRATSPYIHLQYTAITTEGDNVTVDGTTVTITASGTYYVDGTLNDGQIIVNVPDEVADPDTVKIYLNGVSITGLSAPAIYVVNAENTSINLVEGTENVLSDGDTAYSGDYLDTAVIEAKDDITIKGSGTLEITANTQYAIQCNNDIKFTGGTVNITTALEDAVRGKTSVTVKDDAVITIDSEGDGIKSTKGNVSIEGGTVSIKAGNDAIQAETTIDISGGSVVASGDRGLTGGTGVNITGGSVIATATDNQTDSTLLTATQETMLLNCIDDTTQSDGCWKKANAIGVDNTSVSSSVFNKKYKYVLISDSSISSGSTYTLTNIGTGATVTQEISTPAATTFTMTGTITTFDSVNPGGSSDSDTDTDTTVDGEYTITLSTTGIETNAPSSVATISDGVCTIIQPAVFTVTGEMSEGQIVVDVDKTTYPEGVVELDLKGVNLSNSSDSPIYVASIGDEVQIVAKNGYENTISDGTSYTNADDSVGAIYACDDIKIKGSGTLTVNGNSEDAIVCKNDIKIYNGTLIVNAVDDGIRGKDSVTIGNSDDTDFSTLSITVNTQGGDGIKSTETDTTSGDGVITVNGGTINVTAYSDGFQASQALNILNGDITVTTTCPATSSSSSSSQSSGPGSMGNMGGTTDEGNTSSTEVSAKGLKAGCTDDDTGTEIVGTIDISGGNITVDSTDDSVHASGDITVVGGTLQLTSGDDGIHSDANVTIGQGSSSTYDDLTIVIYDCYEGVEGMIINQNSGTVIVNSEDDSYNAAGGADGSGTTSPGGWGGNSGSTSTSSTMALNINGGFVLANASDGDHDGFDSNGSLDITGGIVISNGNEAFDCGDGYSMSYTGGVYVKDTSSESSMGGMGGTSSSLTESVSVSGSISAGTRITLTDGSGNVIVSFIADKSVTSVVAGCIAYSGASVYTGGTFSGSTYFQTIDDTQLAAYGGTLSGGTQLTSSSQGGSNPWG